MGYWIVVVDDDPIELKYAKNLLKDEGMRISCLRSGADLLKFMEHNTPDLVLLDVLMPEMDGFETFHALRILEDNIGKSKTPVFFLTGDDDKDTERRGLRDGASDFLRKPLDKEILLSRIGNTIESNKTIEQLRKKASYDKLTGFLNKSSGAEQIADMCRTSSGVLMMLDLDNFKLINDIFGHDMGDKVLIAFSNILRHNIRSEDLVSRIGGDEFLAFFVNLKSKTAIQALSDRLNAQLIGECLQLMGDDFDLPFGISVGAVLVPDYSRDYHTLFKCADAAMYRVKQNGKHGAWVYEETFSADTNHESDIHTDMSRISIEIEERNNTEGAMVVGKEAFAQIYRFAIRYFKRFNKNAVKVLFLLSSDDPDENISELADAFISFLRSKLRTSDVIVQIKSDQIMVLIPVSDRQEMISVANSFDEDCTKDISKSLHVEFLYEFVPCESSQDG